MVHEKSPSTYEDLSIAIKEYWNHFDKESYFKFGKFLPWNSCHKSTKKGNYVLIYFVNEVHNFFLNIG